MNSKIHTQNIGILTKYIAILTIFLDKRKGDVVIYRLSIIILNENFCINGNAISCYY